MAKPEIIVAAMKHSAQCLSRDLGDPKAMQGWLNIFRCRYVTDKLKHRILSECYDQTVFVIERRERQRAA
jgi:hypothetical protein